MHAAENQMPGPDLIPAADLIALEKARIDNEKHGIEVAKEFVAANERNHQRRLESFESQHVRELEFRRTRHKTHQTILYATSIASFLILCFLLFNAFYGVGQQQEYALMIIKYLAIGLAGYGIISGIAGLFRRLLKSPEA